MNILVTGGAGFIGSHLCDKLLSLHYRVFCLDNFSDFYAPCIKRGNIKKSRENSRFELLSGDLRDKKFLDKIFAQFHFDTIIHLAAMAGVRPSIENPELYYDVNINGTFNLLQQIAVNSKYKDTKTDFIFASSSSVYGNNNKIPFSENDPVDNPISPYAVTKKSGELICYNYHHLYNIPVICLRFFTVYGPRQRPDLAIHKFTKMILNNETIPVYGDGKTKRDYTYIDDIIQGVMKTINYLKKNNDSPLFDIFNLGESRTIELNEMIATIERQLGKKAQIKHLPLQPGDVSQTYANIDKSRQMLGYEPQFDFNDGIAHFVDWLLK